MKKNHIFLLYNCVSKIHLNISNNNYIRITFIILLYSGLLSLLVINIPSIGSDLDLLNVLFHVSLIYQLMNCFINNNKYRYKTYIKVKNNKSIYELSFIFCFR